MKDRKQLRRFLTGAALVTAAVMIGLCLLPEGTGTARATMKTDLAEYHPPSEGILGLGEGEEGNFDDSAEQENPFPWGRVGAGAGLVLIIGCILIIRKKK